ncbi:MAG: Mth938-like domain-containing protein [Coxiellaceae bacterium]|nr:MAG: Mth938-like domain-containing protein [Coxiellaceae bacterium]
MQINQDNANGKYQIQSYEPGKLLINQVVYTHSVIISPTELVTDWPPQTLAELRSEHLAWIAEQRPEVFLLGTGAQLTFPSHALLAPVINQQIGTEIMTTTAACRTFQVLIAEKRHVIAALLIK